MKTKETQGTVCFSKPPMLGQIVRRLKDKEPELELVTERLLEDAAAEILGTTDQSEVIDADRE